MSSKEAPSYNSNLGERAELFVDRISILSTPSVSVTDYIIKEIINNQSENVLFLEMIFKQPV